MKPVTVRYVRENMVIIGHVDRWAPGSFRWVCGRYMGCPTVLSPRTFPTADEAEQALHAHHASTHR